MTFRAIIGYVRCKKLYEWPECKELGTIINRMGYDVDELLLGYMLVESLTPKKFRLLNYCPYYT